MGYIELSKGLDDFTKITISFWFRVPQASLDKAAAADTGEDDGAPFAGIVPLLVIGERGDGDIPYSVEETTTKAYDHTAYGVQGGGNFSESEDVGSGITRLTISYGPNAAIVRSDTTSDDLIYALSIDGAAPPSDATFIGVDSSGTLIVNVETNKTPIVTGYFLKTGVVPGTVIGHGPTNMPSGTPPPPAHAAYFTGTSIEDFRIFPEYHNVIFNDTHWVFYPVQETTITKPRATYTDISETVYSATGNIFSDQITVTPDRWHHVLVSVDLKTISTRGTENPATSYESPLSRYVDSAAKLYVALDDINYTEYGLSSDWNEGGDPNEVITDGAWEIAGTVPDTDDDVVPFPTPTYDLPDPKVPASKKPLGVPARAEFVANIYTVEIAELQIFTGVVLDTGNVQKRRAFIDSDGVPVAPMPKLDSEGNLIPMPSAQVCGKNPEILLTGAANWSLGYNMGTLGVDNDGQMIANGQFKPAGNILVWTPDPSLYGPQKALPHSIRLSKKPVAAE